MCETDPPYPILTRAIFAAHEKWKSVWPFTTGRSSFRHFIDFAAAAGLVPPAWVRTPLGFEMWLDSAEFMQHDILIQGIWSPEVTALFQKWIRPGDHVVDIGANVGYFSLLASLLVGSSGRVTSFEPNPTVFAQLQANIERNGFSVFAHEAACSDTEGTLQLYVNEAGNSGESSLSQENASGHFSHNVRCVIPDAVLEGSPEASFVKIDVEGAEMLVLRGLRRTLAVAHPLLCLEMDDRKLKSMGTTSEELVDYLAGLGYRVRRLGVDVFAY